jgi:hypothetical protein
MRVLLALLALSCFAQEPSNRTYVAWSVANVGQVCGLAAGVATVSLNGAVVWGPAPTYPSDADNCILVVRDATVEGLFEIRVTPATGPFAPTQLSVTVQTGVSK